MVPGSAGRRKGQEINLSFQKSLLKSTSGFHEAPLLPNATDGSATGRQTPSPQHSLPGRCTGIHTVILKDVGQGRAGTVSERYFKPMVGMKPRAETSRQTLVNMC